MIINGKEHEIEEHDDRLDVMCNGGRFTSTRAFNYTIEQAEIVSRLSPDRRCSILYLGYGLGYGAYEVHKAVENDNMVVVDLSPELVNHERAAHNVHSDFNPEVWIGDGLTYVAETPRAFDAIIVDIFDGGISVPSPFLSFSFVGDAEKALKDGGYLLYNIITPRDRDRLSLSAMNHGLQVINGVVTAKVVGELSYNAVTPGSNGNTHVIVTKKRALWYYRTIRVGHAMILLPKEWPLACVKGCYATTPPGQFKEAMPLCYEQHWSHIDHREYL